MLQFEVSLKNLQSVILLINGVGVYSFKTFDGRYIYIGKSINLRDRLLRHRGWISRLIKEYGMTELCIVHCDCEDMDRLERDAIEFHRPFFNTEFNRKDTYVDLTVKVPSFIAFKLKELAATRTQERDVSVLAIKGFESIIRSYQYEGKEKEEVSTTLL